MSLSVWKNVPSILIWISRKISKHIKRLILKNELRYTLDNQFFASNTLPGKKEFISKLTEHWDEINNIGKSQTKDEWIDTLGKFGLKDSYFISNTPKILEKFGIINQNIVLSKSNLVYILSRHVGEYDISTYDEMNGVIKNRKLA